MFYYKSVKRLRKSKHKSLLFTPVSLKPLHATSQWGQIAHEKQMDIPVKQATHSGSKWPPV
ncbi:MAG: hypothetical protein ACUVWO_17045, partial [Thermodesulfobacteriota bacterium]